MLKDRLRNEASLQPLVAQFVPLEIDVNSDEWHPWSNRFGRGDGGIPILYVVRADGHVLYGKTGLPQGDALPQLLTGLRSQAGVLLSPRQFEQLTKAKEKASAALAEGDIEKAITIIAPVVDSGNYSQAAVEASDLVKELLEQAQTGLTEAEQKLASDSTALAGAVQLAEVTRLYRMLPEAKTASADANKRLTKDPARRELFSQAALIDKGQALEQQKQAKRALEQYQSIVGRYPGTPVAELAQERIAKLNAAGVEASKAAASTPASRPATASKPGNSEANERLASSHLRLAKTFAKTRPQKAREYAKKVIDLAPFTNLAREAEALLASLPPDP